MNTPKSWSIVGQFLIALGFLNSFAAIINIVDLASAPGALIGVCSAVIWWYIYQFKNWARESLNMLMALKIFYNFFVLFKGAPVWICLLEMLYAGVNLKFFNSPSIKQLFEK